jgi:adenylate cyclase
MADSYKLVGTSGDQTIDLKPGVTLVVGRAVNSDVPIYDPTISRQHAQVSMQNGGVLVKDLGSSNGTFLNGSKIAEAVAVANDVVMFGKVSFYVREVSKQGEVAPTPATGFPQPKAPQATIVRQLAPDFLSSGRVKRLSLETAAPGEPESTEAAKSAKKLEILLEISKALSRQQEIDKLLETIGDFSFQVMAVDRVSILLGKSAEEMIPRISKSRLGEGFASARHVPRSIVSQVVGDRVAVLTDNAAEDERFKGKSILMQSVRSAMGAPLLASDGSCVGVIYVDNLTSTHAYSADDLDFLIGFAGVASVAMENSQLGERLKREALVLSNFQRYFSPDVAKTIAEHGEQVKLDTGKKKDVVILFSDIRGFTSMSEKMDPDDVAQLLREYFTEMVDIIFRHGGTLDKFIGDAIMALWGAPFGTEDDADKAMRAAIDMQRRLVELNEHWKQSKKPKVQIGIGINFGQVFAGNIGSEQRLEYTVLGDAVNTASRLCSNAGKDQIMISEPLFKRLKFPPEVEAREPIKVKNKEQPVPIYLAKF